MIPSERRDYIYRYVHEYQLASISALSELMSVSHMTVRRDIRVLEEQGKVVSVSGGVRLSEALRQELAYCEKAQLHHRHKREIGKYAAGLVEDGQVVYLDAGTTTFEIARSLAERFNLTVVTNDFSIIQHLMNRPQLSLFHTGGQVDQRNYSCVGNSAAMLLRSLNIDVAFISTSSWDLEHGLSTPHEEKVLVKQALLEVARRRVLVSDSSKYGKYGMFRVCPLEALSDIICDAALPPEAQQLLRERGLQLHNVQL
ncbi:DeoR/GlpR family DNA-binding transcription regulator [Serratia marcescens]|jgi:Transcriptional regulators of sugar metabolism|uniref:DeoR/GlpR family DNA-binding transcription regulator n=2 Tax=Serratia TaxID=613 RepID=A0AAW6WXD4_9GAMM|nr:MULTISPECIES: DeoR/GlpR family DNA-binding transcription regulator [Serratia]MCY4786846.1 DeoR/GlpR family DNA-binding transcription regulator [Acinetobacter baumannii]SAQ07969.1 DeoR family transcriptional regulator [Klebsiella oxytoca]AKL41168.1 alkaline phosphatase [Serratia marcescens]ASM10006.1 alkaline phosphatase [Serratia marcescens]AUY13223.1 DeoR/GlpR transcriptional regulator [Serratia sp. SSNIH1]